VWYIRLEREGKGSYRAGRKGRNEDGTFCLNTGQAEEEMTGSLLIGNNVVLLLSPDSMDEMQWTEEEALERIATGNSRKSAVVQLLNWKFGARSHACHAKYDHFPAPSCSHFSTNTAR
jgi:hypothetical protein